MKTKFWETVKTYLVITLGSLIVAFGVYFFSFPNNFSTGGTSALSVLIAKVVALFAPSAVEIVTPGLIMLVLNVILLIIALIIFGKSFAFKTIYSSLLISLASFLLELFLPISIIPGASVVKDELGNIVSATLTGEPVLELIFAIGCIAIGSAITFSVGASSGGTDIVAMILKKYTKMDISRALFISDVFMVIASFFVFDIKIGLFSLMGLILKSFIVDVAIDGIYLTKCFQIITSRPDEILNYINNNLHRGATVSSASGSFSHEDKHIIITVLSRSQAMQLKEFITSTGDGSDFTIITNSSDIIGKGFRSTV